MVKSAAVTTASDGTFVMPSERDLAFLRAVGWYSLTLSFEHPAYYKSIKTYTPNNATNAPSGEPVIAAGDVPLDRLTK